MVFACSSSPGVMPDGDSYRFRSGSTVDKAALDRARTFAHGAAHQITVAQVYDGRSDLRRDEALTEARAALTEALAALDAATMPEPPRIAPAAVPTIFEVACDIAGTQQREVA